MPETARSVTCSVANNGLSNCLMKYNGRVIAIKDGKPHLMRNRSGQAEPLVPTSSDGRKYSVRYPGKAESFNFDVDYTPESKTTHVTIGDGGHTHRFNFYADHGVITMDKEYTPSIFKEPKKLRLGKSHGVGVFAAADIKAGEVVEEIPMLSQTDSFLSDYTFGHNKQHLLALGYGSLYNHSDDPNITHSISPQGNIITYTANRDIAEGTQCTISYGNLYFLARGIAPDPIQYRGI